MLIAMDPNESVDIVLDGYAGQKEPPTLVCKQLTARERIRIKRLVDQALEAEKAGEHEKTDEHLSAVFAIAVTGWRNINKPFDVKAMGDMLTFAELWELERRIWRETQLSEDAKKKSAFVSASGAASPAPPAAAASAPSETA